MCQSRYVNDTIVKKFLGGGVTGKRLNQNLLAHEEKISKEFFKYRYRIQVGQVLAIPIRTDRTPCIPIDTKQIINDLKKILWIKLIFQSGSFLHCRNDCWRRTQKPTGYQNRSRQRRKNIFDFNIFFMFAYFCQEGRFYNWLENARDWNLSRSRLVTTQCCESGRIYSGPGTDYDCRVGSGPSHVKSIFGNYL